MGQGRLRRAARRPVGRRSAGRGVHISDVYAREQFRHHSYVRDVASVHVVGEGVEGYAHAVDLLVAVISGRAEG